MTRSQLRSGRDENWKLINEKKKLKQKTSNHKKFEKNGQSPWRQSGVVRYEQSMVGRICRTDELEEQR